MERLRFNPSIPVEAMGCYQLCITDTTGAVLFCSGYVEVEANNTCDSLLIRYRNNEDAFGMRYEGNNFWNQIRLPLKLLRPIVGGKSSVFVTSTGETLKLAETLNKTYELLADTLSAHQHEALAIALAHDYVELYLDVEQSWQRIVSIKPYTPKWPKYELYPYAQGEASVQVTSYPNRRNTNCS